MLQDPLGADVQDLSVLHYVTYGIQMSRRVAGMEPPKMQTDEEELNMELLRPTLGKAYTAVTPVANVTPSS